MAEPSQQKRAAALGSCGAVRRRLGSDRISGSRHRSALPFHHRPSPPATTHQDLPAILEREPDLGVLSESILFEDRLSPRLGLPAASCQGRDAYKRLMWSLRFHRTLFFRQAKVR